MITELTHNQVFVFGSNLTGRHGAGAALYAKKYFGAEHGVGIGETGRCYAIPTKDKKIHTLPLARIKLFVLDFLDHAKWYPSKEFLVTEIGCGLAGYTPKEIAPFFKGYTKNVKLPQSFQDILDNQRQIEIAVWNLDRLGIK